MFFHEIWALFFLRKHNNTHGYTPMKTIHTQSIRERIECSKDMRELNKSRIKLENDLQAIRHFLAKCSQASVVMYARDLAFSLSRIYVASLFIQV